ncbi:MAG: Holliday junction DNA helicase RuvA [Candidatus Dadabacteria bacterium RIFCSPHIGHO2_12_FULL_53_21]|nr:MAG: Holliday junction DNA helicase RuvA [Candidatus Dadabacteria bacterium RIFCSPHIGHO2_12_FULL_53_21]
MRILALDVGTRTIGVAVSDELGITANGVATIKRKDIEYDKSELAKFIDLYAPSEILVGIPYRSDGGVGKRGQEIMKFADILKDAFDLPVIYWDESFSTADAERFLISADVGRKKRKQVIDKMAAVYILAEYLESKRPVK